MKALPLAVVTGATGAIGPALVRRLARNGYRIRAFARRPPPRSLLPQGVDTYLGDLTDGRSLETVMRGADVVFHLAAMLHRRIVDETLIVEYDRVNVQGTRMLLESATAAGVRRMVLFSTINVYGPSSPGRVHMEDSPSCPATPYAQSKLMAERVVLDATGSVPEPVVLRLAAAYGRRMKGNYGALVRAIRRGWFIPLGRGDNRRTLVHVEDVAQAALLAAEQPVAAGRVYNVTDGEVYTFRAIVEAIAQAVGRAPPVMHLPSGPVRAMLRTSRYVPGLAGRADLALALVDKLLEDVAVSGERIRRELGYRPAYGLAEGWRDAVATVES